MGLTSGSFGTLMFILAAAGVVAVIVYWPRAARQRPLTMLARVGMIGVSQLLVIAAFLVYLNSYFGFYASWSQLLGSGTTPVVRVAKAARPSQASVVVTGAAPAPVPGGAIAKTTTHIPVAEGHGNTDSADRDTITGSITDIRDADPVQGQGKRPLVQIAHQGIATTMTVSDLTHITVIATADASALKPGVRMRGLSQQAADGTGVIQLLTVRQNSPGK